MQNTAVRNRAVGRIASLVESNRSLWIIGLVYFGAYCAVTGPVMAPDSFTYSIWSDLLIADNFNYAQYLHRRAGGSLAPLYLGMVTIVALIKLVVARWEIVVLLLNIVALASIMASLAQLCLRLMRSRTAALCTVVLCLFCYELFQWGKYALSDMLFTGLALQVFLLAIAMASGERFSKSRLIGSGLTIAFVLVFRPTAILLIPLLAVALLFRFAPVRRTSVAAVVAPTIVIASIAALALSSYVSYRPESFPFTTMADKVKLKAAREATGEVVSQRPHMFRAPPKTYGDFAAIMTERFVRFFQFANKTFSFKHNVVGILFFAPLYFFAVLGVRSSLRSGEDSRVIVVTLACTYVWTTAAFHALTFLDYDWRYRVPVLPALILLASLGLHAVLVKTWSYTSVIDSPSASSA